MANPYSAEVGFSLCYLIPSLNRHPIDSISNFGIQAQPFLFLMGEHESDTESRQVEANIRSIYDRLPRDRRLEIVIRGANHFLFSDDGALLKSHMVLGTLRILGVVGIDGRRQLAVTAYCVQRFFDAYLKIPVGSLSRISSPLYPEIQIK